MCRVCVMCIYIRYCHGVLLAPLITCSFRHFHITYVCIYVHAYYYTTGLPSRPLSPACSDIFIYVCMGICTYVRMGICTYVCLCTYTFTHVNKGKNTHMWIYCENTYIYCKNTHMYIYKAYTAYTHTHTHTHTQRHRHITHHAPPTNKPHSAKVPTATHP